MKFFPPLNMNSPMLYWKDNRAIRVFIVESAEVFLIFFYFRNSKISYIWSRGPARLRSLLSPNQHVCLRIKYTFWSFIHGDAAATLELLFWKFIVFGFC